MAFAINPVNAHGFGERYDLPIPLNYFLVGAASTVALSFVVIGLFVRIPRGNFNYPHHNLLMNRWLGPLLASRALMAIIRVVAVLLLMLVIATSLFGTDMPIENLSPTFVWVIWWVGMAYVAALLGNVWMVINPWKILFEWVEGILGLRVKHEQVGIVRYPKNWDVWPALVLFLVFAWLENVYSSASEPFTLGVLVLIYSLVTWLGMLIFGKHQWLKYGEAFSVLFGFFSRFSPTEVRVTNRNLCRSCDVGCNTDEDHCVDCYECFSKANLNQRELNLRPYAVGLANPGRVQTATAAFVVLALATVTFDGLTATPGWVSFQNQVYSMATSLFGSNALDAIDTIGLILLPVLFLAVYAVFSWGIHRLSDEKAAVRDVAKAFVFSLVPIALAYNIAHFLSLLVIQGQLIVPLVSDPFGLGWNLFGTSDFRLNIGIINAKFVWFMSVATIVVGHILAVYIAHIIALRRSIDHAGALRGQYPMLLLMVAYTATSLWIIAQPIVGDA